MVKAGLHYVCFACAGEANEMIRRTRAGSTISADFNFLSKLGVQSNVIGLFQSYAYLVARIIRFEI
jgi:hypothetical protein